MLDMIKAFFAKYSISTHTLAAAVATLVTLYAAVPAFQSLVDQGYAATPAWFHKVILAVVGIYAFYHGAKKPLA